MSRMAGGLGWGGCGLGLCFQCKWVEKRIVRSKNRRTARLFNTTCMSYGFFPSSSLPRFLARLSAHPRVRAASVFDIYGCPGGSISAGRCSGTGRKGGVSRQGSTWATANRYSPPRTGDLELLNKDCPRGCDTMDCQTCLIGGSSPARADLCPQTSHLRSGCSVVTPSLIACQGHADAQTQGFVRGLRVRSDRAISLYDQRTVPSDKRITSTTSRNVRLARHATDKWSVCCDRQIKPYFC